jgi:hypothetical protein
MRAILTAGLVAGAIASTSSPCTLIVPSPGLPTLTSARDALRQRRRDGTLAASSPAAAVTVCIAAGTYRERLELTSEDSGSGPSSPVVWRPLTDGAVVRISGGVDVDFAPLPADDPARAYLNASVADAIFVTSLPSVGLLPPYPSIQPRGGFEWSCKPGPLALIYQGWTQQVARWPNEDPGGYGGAFALTVAAAHGAAAAGTTSGGGGGVNTATSTFFQAGPDNPLASWRDTADVWAHGYWWVDWSDQWLRVTSFSALPGDAGTNISVSPAAPSNITAGARYYLANSLDALDVAGEFYLNQSSGALYFYPPPPTSGGGGPQGTVAVNTTLLTLDSVSYQTFENVVFEAAVGDAVVCTGCNAVVFTNCTVQNAGASGMLFSASNNSAVDGATVTDVGGRGVSFSGGGDHATLTASNNTISNSTISYFERGCFTYNPGASVETGGRIVSNDISHSPHAGVSLGKGNYHLVQYNVLHHLTMDTFDNAALYFFPGDWTTPWGSLINANFAYLNGFHTARCNLNTQPFRSSLYMDNAGAGLTLTQNVIWQPLPAPYVTPGGGDCPLCASHPLFISATNNDGGRSSAYDNNLIIDTFSQTNVPGALNSSGYYDSGGMLTWDANGRQNTSVYFNEMREVRWNEPPFSTAFPGLAELEDGYYEPTCATSDWRCPSAPWNNSFSLNVLVNVSVAVNFPPPSTNFSSANFNVSSNWEGLDPGFEDADPRVSLNFQLRDDSPVYALGFKRIPMECFGPWKGCAPAW